jgi:hypothetical protein
VYDDFLSGWDEEEEEADWSGLSVFYAKTERERESSI